MEPSRAADEPTRVLIAGGGIAAVETMLALRSIAGPFVEVDLLAPNRELVYAPLSVAEPFGLAGAHRFPLGDIVARAGATLRSGWLTSVDTGAHRAVTSNGDRLGYDVLVVATGARARAAVHGALTILPDQLGAYASLLERLASGERLVFAVPTGSVWPLPIYELALMTSTWLAGRQLDVQLALVTPEERPLAAFGRRVSDTVAGLLEERNVTLSCGRYPIWFEAGQLAQRPGPYLAADHVVALPELRGPAVAGLPADSGGFLPTDRHGAVISAEDVYAAGDGASFPVKHGGLAVLQADAVAEAIAARAGAAIEPQPFEPILDAVLLTGTFPRYLHGEPGGGRGEEASRAEVEPTFWPPTKIAGGHLSRYLARLGAAQPPHKGGESPRLEADDLESYLQGGV